MPTFPLNGAVNLPARSFNVQLLAAGLATAMTGDDAGRYDRVQAVVVSLTDAVAPTSLVSISAAQSKAEGNSGNTIFTYTVTRSLTVGSLVVPWTFAAGGTIADDFTGGILPSGGGVSFADGVATGTFSISVAGDLVVEPDEVFTVSITPPAGTAAGGALSATGTILNDDAAQVTPTLSLSSAVTQAEGDSGTAAFVWTLTLTRNGSTAAYPYTWAVTGTGANAANAADFGGTFPSGSGTFAAGETSKTITVLATGDTAVEPAETFLLTVNATGLTSVTSTGTISNDDVTATPTLSAARMTNTSAAPNTQFSAFVERTFPRSTLSVATLDGTALTMRGTQTSGKFASVPESFIVSETHPTLGTRNTTLLSTTLPAPSVAADGILTTITGTGGSSAIVSPMAALTVPAFASGTPDGQVITIDSSVGYQSMIGFGAALTDSTLQRLTVAMTASQRAAFLQEAFGTNGFTSVRVPIGPNDFQRNTTFPTCNDTPGDFAMANFNLAVEQASGLIDVLKEIVAINPNVEINGAVWSPPAWMKNSNSVTGDVGDNTLKTDADTRNAYALYFVKWVQAIEAAVGVPGIVKTVTVQNEPYNDIAGRPSMLMTTADSIDFVANYMGPVFEAYSIKSRILIGSTSWGSSTGGGSGGYVNGALQDANAGKYLEGSAWHAYNGGPTAQNTSYNANPTKSSHFVEMRTLLAQPTDDTTTLTNSSLGIMMGNVFMGALRGGASRVILWNFALSNSGTPTQGSTGRRGVVRIADDGTVNRSVEYYITAHFAKYLKRGARRIDSTSPGGMGISITDLASVAFQNPDGTIVAVIWNPKLADQATSVVDATSGKFTTVTIPARSFVTLRYSGLVASAQTPAPAPAPSPAPAPAPAPAPSPAPATRSTPTLDANPAAVSQVAYASGITQAITIANGATLLTVSLMAIRTSTGSANRTVASAVSINGVALTQLSLLDSTGNVTQNRHAEIWYMVNPPSGAQTISVDYPKPTDANTNSGNLLISSQSWKGTSVTAGDIFSDRVEAHTTTAAGATNLTATTAVTGVQLAISAIRSTTLPTVSSDATVLANQLTGTNMAGTVTTKTGTDLTATRDWTTADQGVLMAYVIKGALA